MNFAERKLHWSGGKSFKCLLTISVECACMYVVYSRVQTFVQVNVEDRSSFSVTGHLILTKQGLTEPVAQ